MRGRRGSDHGFTLAGLGGHVSNSLTTRVQAGLGGGVTATVCPQEYSQGWAGGIGMPRASDVEG